VFGVMFQAAVRLQMTMNDQVCVAVFLAFVHVLRRNDGKQPHRSAQDTDENSGPAHGTILSEQSVANN